MEAVGLAAAITELSGLAVKSSRVARDLVQSAIHAPAELVDLTARLERLQCRIQMLQNLGKDLSASDATNLFPPEYTSLFSVGLQLNYSTLMSIQSVLDPPTSAERELRKRLKWATVDKRKVTRILEDIKEAETELDLMLNILDTRLASMSQSSLATLITTQAVLRSDYADSVKEIKNLIRDEVASLQTMKGSVTQSPQPSLILGNEGLTPDVSDMRMRLLEYNEQRVLSKYSRAWGDLLEPRISTGERSLRAHIALQSKRNRRRFRAVLQVKFKFLCTRVLQIEIRAQQILHQWLGAPWFDCWMTVVNVRPGDSPIFEACFQLDFWRVKSLIDSGEASVYDFMDTGRGLLEQAVAGKTRAVVTGKLEPELRAKEQLIRFLLERGCNPTLWPVLPADLGDESRCPAILLAFQRDYHDIVSLMELYGGSLYQFEANPATIFTCFREPVDKFRRKIQKLRSTGWSDWKVESPSGHLLYGACCTSALEELMFALEVVGLDPNLESYLAGYSPLWAAVRSNWFEGVAVLIECGVDLNTPKRASLGLSTYFGQTNYTTHYFLHRGADQHIEGPDPIAWYNIWDATFDTSHPKEHYKAKHWRYMHLEGTIAHLLLHGANPFTLFVSDYHNVYRSSARFYAQDRWYDIATQIRASEVARAWSYPLEFGAYWSSYNYLAETWQFKVFDALAYEDLEESRSLKDDVEWSNDGLIFPALENHNPTIDQRYPSDQYGARREEYEFFAAHCQHSGDDELDGDFFREATQFYHHIKSNERRRHLSRFPLVRAFCDALQHAGYRAQMDDDGDIWYECDDGDQYVDTREYQPEGESETPWTEFCPMCQRPEKYGLGRMVRQADKAKRALHEYRAKVKAAQRGFY
ncbi:hypothetical protein F5Y18DRAFT_369114 [Xylariaceae sp. FL1019]|nr:hypothetical protein F5Y18DRAFT_369114 [Xylariaceae sp. FL1019]